MAMALVMDGERFTGRAEVYFETPEAAEKAANQELTVDGSSVLLKLAGVPLPFDDLGCNFYRK